MRRALNILTWHGSPLYYLSRGPYQVRLPVKPVALEMTVVREQETSWP